MMIRDFLLFRRMLTPFLLQILFWILIVVCVLVGLIDLFKAQWQEGLQLIFLAPIFIRIVFEFLLLLFRMNETLTDIRQLQVDENDKLSRVPADDFPPPPLTS